MALFGILNVKKPSGPTSRDVVDDVERLIRPERAGHAGTLDPLAAGVLVICVGRATRLIEYIQRMPKCYRATFLLGRRSETDDVEGAVVEMPAAPRPDREALDRAIPQFLGVIQQRPPAHSAIKLAGRRAYELARRGQTVVLAPRPVTIHCIVVCRYEYPELELEIECGSGTYIRALGRDLAAALGTAAVMSALERSAIGRFRIDDAVTLDELSADTLPHKLQPAVSAVAELPQLAVDEAQLIEIRNGRPIGVPLNASGGAAKPTLGRELGAERQAAGDADLRAGGEWAALDARGELVAILREKHAGQLWPMKNFL